VSIPTRASIRRQLAEENRIIKRGPPEACQVERMGYVQWHLMADELTRKGVRQTMCAACQRWKSPRERCEKFVAKEAT
jgi:hypothetical protein